MSFGVLMLFEVNILACLAWWSAAFLCLVIVNSCCFLLSFFCRFLSTLGGLFFLMFFCWPRFALERCREDFIDLNESECGLSLQSECVLLLQRRTAYGCFLPSFLLLLRLILFL